MKVNVEGNLKIIIKITIISGRWSEAEKDENTNKYYIN